MRKLLLLLAVLLLSGLNSCAYNSTISFSEDGKSATLKSNTKSNAKIDLKNKTAEVEQLGITPLDRLKGFMPKSVDIAK